MPNVWASYIILVNMIDVTIKSHVHLYRTCHLRLISAKMCKQVEYGCPQHDQMNVMCCEFHTTSHVLCWALGGATISFPMSFTWASHIAISMRMGLGSTQSM